MSLPRLFVRRPIVAIAGAIAVVVFGIAALVAIPVREFPDIERPVVSVTTPIPGAAAEVVERDVTQVIEEALSDVAGIDLIESRSVAGQSSVEATFTLDTDLDAAAAEVRDNVSAVRDELPDDAEEPVIAKVAADAQPIMWIALTSDARDVLALTDLADRRLVDPLSVVPGVARVQVGGGERYVMRIDLDVARMAARGVTASDVAAALRAQNVEIPAGRIVGERRELTVRTDTRLSDASSFEEIVLRAEEGGRRVRLADVAEIFVGAEEPRTAVFRDGERSVGLGIVRASGANSVAVAGAVREELEALRATLPEGVGLQVTYDEAIFVEESISEVVFTLGITAILVVSVIFLFLGSIRGALVPAVTIPVSLVGTFAVLYALGFSLNVLTMLALVLSIGLVVDDAIVVLENVTRRMERGEPRLAAAARGTQEVFVPVVATTLVLVAVLAPVAALTGTTGRLFTEFAIAMTSALVISSALALTTGAAIASLIAKPVDPGKSRVLGLFSRGLERAREGYGRIVGSLVRRPWLSLVFCLVVGAGGASIFLALPAELAPDEDRGTAIVSVETAPGSTIEETIAAFETVREIIGDESRGFDDDPVEGTTTLVGVGGGGGANVASGIMIVQLKPWGERETSQMQLVEALNARLRTLPQAQASAINPSGLVPAGFGKPIQLAIQAPDYERAEEWARALLGRVQDAGVQALELEFDRNTPQLLVDVDRARAADLGIDVAQIGEALRVVLGGDDVTEFVFEGETYDVIVRAAPRDRASPADLGRIELRTRAGDLVPLALVARASEIGAPDEYVRIDRRPSVVISAVPDEASLGDALERFEAEAAEIMPGEGGTATLGLSREFEEAREGLVPIFVLALVVVFLTLAALFDSFVYPFVILIAVPLAVAGGLLALLASGAGFGIYGQISMLLLVGLLAKNAILLVDFANARRSEGMEVAEAITKAARTRFRPILMTSIATAFGAVPLALASGAGAEARGIIGLVILVGVTGATAITLLVVPGLYALLAKIAGEPGARARALDEALAQEAPKEGRAQAG